MTVFSPADIFAIAVKIEANGERFYKQAYERATDDEAKKVLKHLYEEEINHRKIFTELGDTWSKSITDGGKTSEYLEYLNKFVNAVLFPDAPGGEDLEKVMETLPAIRYAIQKELDSIYYYKEIKEFLPQPGHAAIDEVIEEERKHFLQLIKLEKILG